jgi:NADH-quinone oxidoreductase subunit E
MSYIPSAEARGKIDRAVAAYPEASAALLPVLHVVQGESGHISQEAEAWVAARLGILPIRVREAVTFYTMFRRRPSGRTVIRVCRNLSCTLAGAESVVAALRGELGLGAGDGDTASDGSVTLVTVECLGNCDRAPCLQVDGVDRGPVTPEAAIAIVREIRGR